MTVSPLLLSTQLLGRAHLFKAAGVAERALDLDQSDLGPSWNMLSQVNPCVISQPKGENLEEGLGETVILHTDENDGRTPPLREGRCMIILGASFVVCTKGAPHGGDVSGKTKMKK